MLNLRIMLYWDLNRGLEIREEVSGDLIGFTKTGSLLKKHLDRYLYRKHSVSDGDMFKVSVAQHDPILEEPEKLTDDENLINLCKLLTAKIDY